jgi:hypothetical protein
MGTFGNVISTIYKAYFYKTLIRDVSRFARKAFDDVEFDKESLLNRIGLSTYTPVRSTIGGLSFFVVGAAVGTAIGLALAPKPGAELRAEVKEKAMDLIGRSGEGLLERRAQA